MPDRATLQPLLDFLAKVPGIGPTMGSGFHDDARWWVKFAINIDHPLAWQVVQELGHVLNYVSLDERLPTVFKPVSPAPYLNGGPKDYLSWVIECEDSDFAPSQCAKWLEGRMPRPVDDPELWKHDD